MSTKLRPMTEADLDITFQWRNDPEVLKNAQTPSPISFKEHEAMFTHNNAVKLVYEVDGKPAGFVSCSREPEAGIGEWAFHLGDGYRGKGLAENMLKAALLYLKQEESYNTIKSRVFVHNLVSNYLHIKLGFDNASNKYNFIEYEIKL